MESLAGAAPNPSLSHLAGAAGARRSGLALLLMVASGFAALAYQIVWTQQTALWLGHETAAVLAVMAAFFGGLAAGALGLGRHIARSARPVRWYACCELAIGLWGLALTLLLPGVSSLLLELIGPDPSALWHWAVAFTGCFVLLLPATMAMGATLPAMEQALARLGGIGAPLPLLYAGNTLGAVAGVLGAAFVLIPAWGLTATVVLCAGLNLLCAGLALRTLPEAPGTALAPSTDRAVGLLRKLVATGLLGIGYEVVVVRVLSQVAENTVYTFALLLAVYLVGTTLGAAIYARRLVHRAEEPALQDRLLGALGGACLLGIFAMQHAVGLKAWFAGLLGSGMGAALAGEALLALLAFVLPTMAMGALFSQLASAAKSAGTDFGRALGVNTLGAAFAPLLFGVMLVPALGTAPTLLSIAAGYLALASRQAWKQKAFWGLAAALVVTAVLVPSLVIVDVPPGGRVLQYAEGAMAAVSIVEDAGGTARLHIDNRQQEGSSATLYSDARQALLPLLLHPAPRRALFLGLGTGVTARAAVWDPALSVEAVELLPEVIAASGYFADAAGVEREHPRLKILSADARRFVKASRERFDLIVSDNFHPARSGSGSLYTVEHFRAVRARLAPGGVFCQWLPLHQLDLESLRSIVASFTQAYPRAWAVLATNSLETPVIGLIGRGDASGFDEAALRVRLAGTDFSQSPADFGFEDEWALFGSFVAGPGALGRFARGAGLNTDDHPVVAYRAPRITYAPDSLPRDRLLAFLAEVDVAAPEVFDGAAEDSGARLAAYWQARDAFIAAGRKVRPSADVAEMLAQVRAPLLAVLRASPDFRPAYDPLLRLAAALARRDPSAARALLEALQQLQPARPEAGRLIATLARG